jgi:PAS domain S-box-containing protein
LVKGMRFLSILLLSIMSALTWRLLKLQKKVAADQEELELSRARVRKNQERYDLALLGAHDGIWDWDLENDRVFYSEIAHQQLGYQPGEIDMRNRDALLAMIHPDDRIRVTTAIEQHLERRGPYDVEYRVLTKSGEYKWIHSRGQAIWDASGKPLRFAGSHRDITERIRAQEQLKQSDSRFRQMASNIHEIFWITDPRGAVPLFVSPAYEQIYGRSVESLFENPKQFFEATHPDDRGKLASIIRRQREVDHPCEIEFRICRPNGSIRWIWARLCPILDENGILTGLCGISNDITEKKETEKRVSEFYSMVSHELRTPLTSIRGSLRLIEGGRAGELPDKAMQLVKIGRTESDRLMRLINDILDIKKVEGGQFQLSKSTVEPRQLIAVALDGMKTQASDAKVKLRTSVTTTHRLLGDSERLLQVLTNLISNAIKFSEKNSEVCITVEERPNNSIRFAVSDQGPGIPAHQMHKLFNMFQQLDSSDSRLKGGTGLGLAISKSIVELHGGQIGVESNEGEGSVFWFEVPIDRSNVKDRANVTKVLIVTLDKHWTGAFSSVFEGGAFDAVYVDNIGAAENQLLENTPDVIILDLQSTDGAGLDFLQSLRKKGETDPIPVLVLTAHEHEAEGHGQALLMYWIAKPFELKQIKKALANALRRRQPGPVKILIVEDDATTRQILREHIGTLEVDCLEAKDGLEAVDIARNQRLDLMILDLGLPLLDGFEVIRILKEGQNKHLPLIVYTNRDLSNEDKENLLLGLTSHLVKSRTSEEELIDCVRNLLNGLLEQED